MTEEHVCDSDGNVTIGMRPHGMVECIRCSVCDAIQVEVDK